MKAELLASSQECSKVKSDPEVAAAVLAAFSKVADKSAPETALDATEDQALRQLAKKCKASQPYVCDTYLSKEKQEELTMALYDFFLETSDCVAVHASSFENILPACWLSALEP